MGLTNPDVFVFNNGVEKANTYISFGNETLYVRQDMNMYPMGPMGSMQPPSISDRKYRINANYNIYWDKHARFSNKPFIQQGYVSAVFDDPSPVNVYGCLYDVLKQTVFPNATDSIPNDPDLVKVGTDTEPTEPTTETTEVTEPST